MLPWFTVCNEMKIWYLEHGRGMRNKTQEYNISTIPKNWNIDCVNTVIKLSYTIHMN